MISLFLCTGRLIDTVIFGRRRQERESAIGSEAALRVLFQVEVGRDDVDAAIAYNASELALDEKDLRFTEKLVRGVVKHRAELDKLLNSYAVDWTVERMAYVDRNVLRLAAFEMLYETKRLQVLRSMKPLSWRSDMVRTNRENSSMAFLATLPGREASAKLNAEARVPMKPATALGFDTSAYTTSVALVTHSGEVLADKRRVLPVPEGERGLRQSEAFFHHVRHLPELIEEMAPLLQTYPPDIVAASNAPRNLPDSYMPVFRAGSSWARSIAALLGIPYVERSHQEGHLWAAFLDRRQSIHVGEPFLAVHISGGTTEAIVGSFGMTAGLSAGLPATRAILRPESSSIDWVLPLGCLFRREPHWSGWLLRPPKIHCRKFR